MALFNMITNPPAHLIPEADDINNQYFTVDTADMEVVHQWLRFNPHIVTYAMHKEHVLGFFNIMPLTRECGELFEREAIKEEDLRIEHMLPYESLPHARYAYIAAIAVKDTENYISRQCVAAMVACMADLLLHGYGKPLKKIFVNPTTFQGNKFVSKLGLKPADTRNKLLKENDIYLAELDPHARKVMQNLSDRYSRFVGENPWRKHIGWADGDAYKTNMSK